MNTYFFLQLGCWFVAAVLLLLGLRLLLRKGRLVPLLIGNFALLGLVSAGMLVSFAIDLSGYEEWQEQQAVGEISFIEYKPGVYISKLSRDGYPDRSFELRGEHWLLDARSIAWQGVVGELGISAVYRFDRLSARHVNLGDDLGVDKYVYELGTSRYSLDTWKILNKIQSVLPWMTPQYAPGVSLPMAHEAQYEIVYTQDGLHARPTNDKATVAADGWL